MHDDELPVTVELVRGLITDQFPEWRSLPVHRVGRSGTVHAIFRIGDDLTARLPLRPVEPETARAAFDHEAAASGELGEHLSIAIPQVVAVGEPGCGYPLPWAVHRWLPGETADAAQPADPIALAHHLTDVIAAIRAVPTRGRTFNGSGRGGELPDHDPWIATCLERSAGLLPVEQIGQLWKTLRSLPRAAHDTMAHGDLIPGNIVLRNGRLAGLLDLASYGAADPALDLIVAWHLFDDRPRTALRERLGCDDVEWQRGMAWALQQSVGLVWYYESTNPPMSRMGRRALERILAATD